jgi:ubiquinone/menaquinone biosynthesis C-methylase UbiE
MSACTGAPCDFERDYEIAQAPLMREIEHRVRGSNYGATSWATREQVQQSAGRLSLTRGMCLLDMGAGSGWPALFLATLSGCDVVLTDLPLSGLRIARARAMHDGLGSRCRVLAADCAALPFPDRRFDCVHHADVLCCMERKREMLHECRRVAQPGARMEFSVISLARKRASDEERQLLQKSGPPYPDAEADYSALLSKAGWGVVERIDVTPEFARCMDILLEELHARRGALLELVGGRTTLNGWCIAAALGLPFRAVCSGERSLSPPDSKGIIGVMATSFIVSTRLR